MIFFEYPWVLLLLLSLPFLPRLLRRISGKQPWKRARFSSVEVARKAKSYEALFSRLPSILVGFALALGVLAFANPQGNIMVKRQVDRGYRIVFAFDMSDSMRGDRLNEAKKASIALVKKRKTDVFAVMPFNDQALFQSGIAFTTDRELVVDTLAKLETDGSTAVGNGLLGALWLMYADVFAVNELAKKSGSLPSYDEFHRMLSSKDAQQTDRLLQTVLQTFGRVDGAFIVAVTDAESNTGIPPVDVIEFAGRLGVSMYLIGIETNEDETLAAALRDNGGDYFLAKSPEDIEAMYRTIDHLRPTMTNVVLLPERKTLRPYLFLAAFICFLSALSIRSGYVLIE